MKTSTWKHEQIPKLFAIRADASVDTNQVISALEFMFSGVLPWTGVVSVTALTVKCVMDVSCVSQHGDRLVLHVTRDTLSYLSISVSLC